MAFTCSEPGASTFIELAAACLRSVRLNDVEVDTSAWSAKSGLVLPGLAADNRLIVDADDLFLITRQGFDFFQQEFDVRCPLPKYDQVWVADFNGPRWRTSAALCMARSTSSRR